MAEIIAQGAEATSQSRRTLRKHETFRIGRDPAGWCISWERWLSKQHVELTWDGDTLKATALPDATNPVFFRGEPAGNFAMRRGECFVVGTTTFRLNTDEASSPTPTPTPTPLVDNAAILHSFTVSAVELRQVPFRDAPRRLDVLTHLTKLIFGAVNDEELHAQATELLLEGVRGADAVAWVAIDETAGKTELRVLHGDRRRLLEDGFRPSRRLVQEAVLHKHDSVVHIWTEAESESMQQFTMQGNFDWAFCTPLRSEVCKGQGLYVTGRSTESEPSALLAPWRTNELSEDVKFTELVADILGAMLQTQMLQHRQSVLSHFFSPNVLQLLATADPETALHPRETQVTSLFCDLRGFSQKVESAARNLPEILERVSAALGVMSTAILRQKGVVADFLGDCAMGFWGWPIPQPDDALRACAAALDIRKAFEEFSRIPGHPLADFRVGVGIATGQAVAGQIGSRDQVKVTAFGPSVNLASRLEGLTKKLRVPVLLDEETTRMIDSSMTADVGRCRRLARVRPFGLQAPLTVSELLPPADVDPTHTTEHIALYESALDAFLAGRWSEAYELLHQIPAQDLGKDFLVSYILQHNHSPPQGWDGVIAIEAK